MLNSSLDCLEQDTYDVEVEYPDNTPRAVILQHTIDEDYDVRWEKHLGSGVDGRVVLCRNLKTDKVSSCSKPVFTHP